MDASAYCRSWRRPLQLAAPPAPQPTLATRRRGMQPLHSHRSLPKIFLTTGHVVAFTGTRIHQIHASPQHPPIPSRSLLLTRIFNHLHAIAQRQPGRATTLCSLLCGWLLWCRRLLLAHRRLGQRCRRRSDSWSWGRSPRTPRTLAISKEGIEERGIACCSIACCSRLREWHGEWMLQSLRCALSISATTAG